MTSLLLLILSCGQQQRLKVTYLSDPPGGTLYKKNGERWGPCPKVLWYDLSGEYLAAGELQARGLMVRWPNGAEKRSQDRIRFEIDGSDKRFTFVQPDRASSDQQLASADIETTSLDINIEENDPGIREEPDERRVTTTTSVENEDQQEVIVENVLKRPDDARQKTEQNSEFREEPDEETARTAKADYDADRNDGIIEMPSTAYRIRSERDTAMREKPEGKQTKRIKTAVPVETVKRKKSDQADPNQTKSESSAKTIDDPNMNTIQVKVPTRTVDIGDGVMMEFALIPSGEFSVRLDVDETGGDSSQSPTQRITITKSFYMGRCEVTQEQYEKIMGVNPAQFESPNRPVDTVSWYEATEFCNKLSSTLNVPFRLPTEAEWEYACRAGTTTTYYWGDDFDSRYARTIEDRSSGTSNVKTRLPNAWGLYDMSGNVWEWCADWYSKRDSDLESAVDPKGPSGANFRVLRGGSWGNSRRNCRCAHRNWHTPNHRYDDCGFRVVMEARSVSK
jgi:formylglycine-generating enzyme required for sulfatase activity